MTRWVRVALTVGALQVLAASCSSTDATTTSSVGPTEATESTVSSSPATVEAGAGSSASSMPGLSDDELVAAAIAALAAAGEPVGDERAPILKRSDTTAEVSFPTRPDLPPVVGGEPHVHLDPQTGEVLRISHTR